MNKTTKKIEDQLNNNKTIIYIKGTPENPACGFSAIVTNILDNLGIEYYYINVLENDDIRKELPIYSKWPTFPQVYHKGTLIGGADIIRELYEKNELSKIFKE